MIGKKLLLLQNGQIVQEHEALFDGDHVEELKNTIIKNTKKYSYISLVTVIRLYFRLLNLLKNKYIELKDKINKRRSGHLTEKQEISKFLKIISEYKHKIRNIKNKIKEEEKGL